MSYLYLGLSTRVGSKDEPAVARLHAEQAQRRPAISVHVDLRVPIFGDVEQPFVYVSREFELEEPAYQFRKVLVLLISRSAEVFHVRERSAAVVIESHLAVQAYLHIGRLIVALDDRVGALRRQVKRGIIDALAVINFVVAARIVMPVGKLEVIRRGVSYVHHHIVIVVLHAQAAQFDVFTRVLHKDKL